MVARSTLVSRQRARMSRKRRYSLKPTTGFILGADLTCLVNHLAAFTLQSGVGLKERLITVLPASYLGAWIQCDVSILLLRQRLHIISNVCCFCEGKQ